MAIRAYTHSSAATFVATYYYYYYYTLFLPRGKVRPADKLQLKAATNLPLVGLARSKQDPVGPIATYRAYKSPQHGLVSQLIKSQVPNPHALPVPDIYPSISDTPGLPGTQLLPTRLHISGIRDRKTHRTTPSIRESPPGVLD